MPEVIGKVIANGHSMTLFKTPEPGFLEYCPWLDFTETMRAVEMPERIHSFLEEWLTRSPAGPFIHSTEFGGKAVRLVPAMTILGLLGALVGYGMPKVHAEALTAITTLMIEKLVKASGIEQDSREVFANMSEQYASRKEAFGMRSGTVH